MTGFNEYLEMDDFCAWIDRYLNFEKTPKKNIFWLETMKFLCGKLGNPEQKSRCFHVAGSKGKGSVSAMISSVLDEMGFFTGVYSSPHIEHFLERVQSADGPFENRVYEQAAENVMSCVEKWKDLLPEGRPLTWFELVTVFAMECYAIAKCDWAVYEVGLGGRLDATNVVLPECCCISAIEKEHTEYLGDTVEKIAFEKGGIIKKGVPVVIGRQQFEGARRVLENCARERGAPVVDAESLCNISEVVYNSRQYNSTVLDNSSKVEYKSAQSDGFGISFTLSSPLFSRPLHPNLKLLGEFQAHNAAVAALAVKTVFPDASEDLIEKGLSKASIPGRFEILQDISRYSGLEALVLDGAHTISSVTFTMQTFEKLFSGKKAVLLFGCAADKDVQHMAPLFKERFDGVFVTKPGEVKACSLNGMDFAFSDAGIPHQTISETSYAIETALSCAMEKGAVLLVTGSFYLVSEVKKYLRKT